MEIQTEIESPVQKDELEDCKGLHVRVSNKQKLKQSIQKQDEPVAGVKGEKLSKKGKSKPVVNYPSRSNTSATNKLRLNSKALLHPAIKKENVIIIDDDTVESTEEKGQSPMTSSHKLKKVKLEPEEEHYNEPVEKQRKNEKGKQIAKHPKRHVTKEKKR
jgi:hypothetical protein